ncbi:MAG: aminopeptidase P family protein, partial [Sinomonas sp.]|nr:aminopeptidase P family protein [Sinomonas sp.]
MSVSIDSTTTPLFYPGDGLQERKLARMRAVMAERGLDALLFIKHDAVRWVTGFYAKGYRPFIELEYVALLMADGPVVLGTALSGEQSRATARGRADRVIQLGKQATWPRAVADLLAEHELETGRIGYDFLTAGLHAGLRELCPLADLVDASNVWTDATKIKDPEEVELLRRALAIAQDGMRVALDLIHGEDAPRELDVAAAAEFEMRRAGSEMTPFITNVASGANAAVFERLATERRIQDGDMVIIDLGCVYRGYTGDFARGAVRGTASPAQRRLYRAAWLAQQEAIRAIRPGVACSTIDVIARRVLADEGYAAYTMPWATGHQLGYGLHGAPVIAPGVDDLLEPGMVINIEPAAC